MGLENKTPTPPSIIEKLADAVIETLQERDAIDQFLWHAQVDGRCRHCKRKLPLQRIVGNGLCFECELVEDVRDEFLQKRRPL